MLLLLFIISSFFLNRSQFVELQICVICFEAPLNQRVNIIKALIFGYKFIVCWRWKRKQRVIYHFVKPHIEFVFYCGLLAILTMIMTTNDGSLSKKGLNTHLFRIGAWCFQNTFDNTFVASNVDRLIVP